MDLDKFNPSINYIGYSQSHYNITNWIRKLYRDINFTSFKHDIHYSLMLSERNHIVRFIMKLMYDLIFLVLGITRLIKNFRPDGILPLVILYLILLVTTPFYLWWNRETSVIL